jgi:membrane associated rhomboid family serine protease
MGIENRDYTRDWDYSGSLAGWGFDYISPVVKWIIVANVVIFVLQILVTRGMTAADVQARLDRMPRATREALVRQRQHVVEQMQQRGEEGASAEQLEALESLDQMPEFFFGFEPRVSIVQEWLQLDTRKTLWRGQVWRVVSYAFCHDRLSIWHILFNMLALFWFGVTLESMYGPREFLLFYLAGAVVSAAAQIGIDLALGSSVPVVGASGAVLAVAMLYAIHYPRNTIRVFWFWPVEIRWIVLAYVLFSIHPLLLALAGEQLYSGFYAGTAHAAHLGGLAFGFVYWRMGWNLERWWDRIPKPKSAGLPRPRRAAPPVRRAPEEQFDAEVDEVLKKISESGRESLTPHERRILDLASQRYKRRQEAGGA